MPSGDTVMMDAPAIDVGARVGQAAPTAIAEQLRRDILHGLVVGGSRMRQDAVASRFGVSQNTAREAFRQLEAEGFLRSEPRRGVSVVPLTAGEAREITELRVLLEVQALNWALEAFDVARLGRAETILRQLDEARTVDAIIDLNAAFHRTLYEPAGRERALALIETLRLNFERYLRLTWQETEHHRRSQEQHRELLHACYRGDRARAGSLLHDHIWDTGKIMIENLERSSSG